MVSLLRFGYTDRMLTQVLGYCHSMCVLIELCLWGRKGRYNLYRCRKSFSTDSDFFRAITSRAASLFLHIWSSWWAIISQVMRPTLVQREFLGSTSLEANRSKLSGEVGLARPTERAASMESWLGIYIGAADRLAWRIRTHQLISEVLPKTCLFLVTLSLNCRVGQSPLWTIANW
jgi:hypothetical protein